MKQANLLALLSLCTESASALLQPSIKRATVPPIPIATSATSLHASFGSNGSSMETPRDLMRKGMSSFQRDGDVPASLDYFDRADDLSDGSLAPYLWQRGISYYYLDQFQKGSDQFRMDVRFNPLDVEEIVWDIACLASLDAGAGAAGFPPAGRMALPEGKRDRRKIMGAVYSLFRGDGASEFDLMEAGHGGNASDEFYSLFYLGLYCEIRSETTKAETYMKAAASSAYATGNGAGDYMASCAKVHCKLRGWAV